MGLSLGDAHAALVASDIGRPILVLVGGTGCMNHLSYSLASEPSAIWRLMLSSTAFLNAGSSLRNMQAIGSTDSTSPTILKSAGFLDLEMLAARMEPSITNASARPVSSSRKLSAWSLP